MYIKSLVSHELLESTVLPLELLEALDVADAHPPVLGFPAVVGGLADALLAAYLRDRRAGFTFLQDGDDLALCEPPPAHLNPFILRGQAIIKAGPNGGGYVSTAS